MTKPHLDIHQHITNQIIEAIEKGAGEFRCPWHRAAGNIMRPTNVASKKAYQGVNVLSLWAAADAKGYESGVWGTYKQWADAGAQVCKGAKASMIVFYKQLDVKTEVEQGEDASTERRLFARATPVFAAEQVEGYQIPTAEKPSASLFDPIEAAEKYIAATGAVIKHGGTRAFYHRVTDEITLPPREAFVGSPTSTAREAYYSTALHELGHFTGHATRLDRDFGKRFGINEIAVEELVAEFTAAFKCSELGVSTTLPPDHAQYIDNWLKILRSDNKALFLASSKASQAVRYLDELQPKPTAPQP